MTTPTPGDLSARLLADAITYHRQQANGTPDQFGNRPTKPNVELEAWHTNVADMLAALSALPAGGVSAKLLEWREESTGWWSDSRLGFNIEHNPEEEPDYRYTATWGEGDSEHFATLHEAKAWCQEQADAWICDCGQATAPPPDAAVGAQGDGEAAARAAFEQQAKGWRNAIPWDELHDDTRKLWRDFVARRAALSAAPAAGKGVERIISEMRGEAYAFGSSWVSGRKLAEWANRLSALTRQPVAGDGIRAATPEEEAAIDAALGYTKLTLRLPSDLLAAVGEAAAREGLVRMAMIRALIKRGLSSENTPAEPAQTAPAATPTDGGEGES